MMNLLPLLAVLPALVLSYQHFQEKIPNGDRVPHPFRTNYVWSGVGHANENGGGRRNPFGRDFARNSYIWDSCICKHDSDGDGKTNGEELGDPDCVWRPGSQPSVNTGLTHPGICEPVDSELCQDKNDIEVEETEPFNCPAVEDEGVIVKDIRMDKTEIPAKETTYFCQYIPLDLPDPDKDYHIIAFEPIIDNVEVMHHTLVYGCRDDFVAEKGLANKTNTAEECGPMECEEMMIIWAVGVNGKCYQEDFGALIGKGGFKWLHMQQHWNNPQKKAGMTHSSGVRIHYTPELRDNTFAYIFWGPLALNLPVGQ